MLKFSQKEKACGAKIYRKFIAEKTNNPKAPIISFQHLHGILTTEEKKLLQKILLVDPKDYGKNFTIFYGIKPPPKNLVAIKNQKYIIDKRLKKVKTQFLPRPVFVAFQKLRRAMKKDLGSSINVLSGYRSPAYQALILFVVLFENNWSVQKTLQRLTLPGCSEHGYPAHQAVDFAPERGIKELNNFYKTKEFRWLLKNGPKFGWHLSYPAGNKYGVIFEPWHWRHNNR